MLIGDLAFKDFLYRISSMYSRSMTDQHKITVTFTGCSSNTTSSLQLQRKALQLMEYFWWDFPDVEILNCLDPLAVDATLKGIHGSKFNTSLELAWHIEALRVKGNEDMESDRIMDALLKYERARHIYCASTRTIIGHSWRSNAGSDVLNLDEIRFNLFSDISAAYLGLAKQQGPNQLQLGIAAVDAAENAFPPPPYFRPSDAQRAKTFHCLGAAAHLIGDLMVASLALKKAANLSPEDLGVRQELMEVTQALATAGKPSRRPRRLDEAWKKKGWYLRFVLEKMMPLKFE